jgi:ATP-dependent DNA ligase
VWRDRWSFRTAKTRNGHDWAPRYPLIVEAVNALKVRSCLIDGEAVACDENGLAVFELLRQKRKGRHVFLYAFEMATIRPPFRLGLRCLCYQEHRRDSG